MNHRAPHSLRARRAALAPIAMLMIATAPLVGLVGLVGCKGETKCADADAAVVDTDLLAYLSAARALHHRANVSEDSNDLAGAIAAMEQLVATEPPRQAPEIEEVLADAYARLAELRIRAKDLDRAMKNVDQGLAHAPTQSYFRGHLLEVESIALEERAKTLDQAGKKEEAQAARARALQLADEVVKIQMQVIDKALGPPRAAPSTRSNEGKKP